MSAWIPPINSLKSTLDREKPQAGLYIVSTPIGNAGDITLRALHTLGNVDLILCEDTRVSKKLLSLFEIPTKLQAYHEHNAEKMRPKILDQLKKQASIALISDAGTPLISDPGYKLVKEAVEDGIYVTAVPGASAPITALTLSGLPTDQFYFAGFSPNKSSARKKFYRDLGEIRGSLIIFESAQRLVSSLKDLHSSLGNRTVALTRELTKKFEEFKTEPVETLIKHYEQKRPPKGEIVLVIEGAISAPESTDDQVKNHLQQALDTGHSVKDAVDQVSKSLQTQKRRVYKLALELVK